MSLNRKNDDLGPCQMLQTAFADYKFISNLLNIHLLRLTELTGIHVPVDVTPNKTMGNAR